MIGWQKCEHFIKINKPKENNVFQYPLSTNHCIEYKNFKNLPHQFCTSQNSFSLFIYLYVERTIKERQSYLKFRLRKLQIFRSPRNAILENKYKCDVCVRRIFAIARKCICYWSFKQLANFKKKRMQAVHRRLSLDFKLCLKLERVGFRLPSIQSVTIDNY